MFNKTINEISRQIHAGHVVSRVMHNGEMKPATSDTVIHENDILLVVAQKGLLSTIVKEFGSLNDIDLAGEKGKLALRRRAHLDGMWSRHHPGSTFPCRSVCPIFSKKQLY